MQSLNAQFKQAIVENLYNYSNFDGKQYPLEELQICHILSKSKRTLNAIKKAYNCSDKTAEIIMNMPLLNTVVGSRKHNEYYFNTYNITYVDNKIMRIVKDIIKENKLDDYFKDTKICLIYDFIINLCFIDGFSLYKGRNSFEWLKEWQLQFHKEIDLHF